MYAKLSNLFECSGFDYTDDYEIPDSDEEIPIDKNGHLEGAPDLDELYGAIQIDAMGIEKNLTNGPTETIRKKTEQLSISPTRCFYSCHQGKYCMVFRSTSDQINI